MMRLNFMLAALFVASAVSAPVHNVVSSLLSPFPQVPTAVPTTSTLSTQSPKAVPTSVWQHNRRVVDSDGIRPLRQPAAGALPLLSSPPSHGDKTVEVRAVTSTHGHAAAAAAVPFPTATTPTAHAHVHRAPSGCDNDDAEDGADRDDKRDLHARMLVIPIKGLGQPHTTTTLHNIKARQLFMPTALFNVAATAKVAVA